MTSRNSTRRLATLFAALFTTLALAACAPFEQSERPVSREQARCDVAVAEGMACGIL